MKNQSPGDKNKWLSQWSSKTSACGVVRSGYYAESPVDDPTGPTSGSIRVLRDGGWIFTTRICRSAYRSRNRPSDRSSYLGFRLAFGAVE